MSDYIIDFTDPANGSFVIKPMTTDGPASPAAATPLDPQAVSAHTSVVLLGKGMFTYGERVAESAVHMIEHFAYQSRPAYAIQGQLWYKNIDFIDPLNPLDPVAKGLYLWDGVAWEPVLIGSFPISGNLDMGGFRILNLGDPVLFTDAVNLGFGDTRWVNVTGDTITGALTITNDLILVGVGSQVTLPNAPVAGFDATNKNYVDGLVGGTSLASLTDVTLTAPVNNDFLRYNGVKWVNTPLIEYLNLTDLGDVTIPVLPLTPGDVLTWDGGVWTNQPAAASTDRYVVSGALGITLPTTLTLTFSTALPTPTIDITGISPDGHSHITFDILRDVYVPDTTMSPSPTEPPSVYDLSYVRELAIAPYPQNNYPAGVTLEQVIQAFDQALYFQTAFNEREIFQGDGTTSAFTLDIDYVTQSNKLSVYNNGVKQYASQRAQLLIQFTSGNVGSDTGLADGTYTFDLNVDGTLYSGGTAITVIVAETLLIITATPGVHGTWTVGPGDFTSFYGPGTYFTVLGSSVLAADKVYTVRATSFDGVNTGISVENSYSPGPGPDGIGIPAGVYGAAGTVRKPYYFQQLTEDIDASMTSLAIPASVFFKNSGLSFYSDIVGTLSSIFFTDVTLFAAITTAHTTYYGGSHVPIVTATATGGPPDTLTISGDYSAAFNTGTHFIIYTSAANDGEYVTTAPATFAAGITTIYVNALVADSGASGIIYFARSLSYDESGPVDGSLQNVITFVTPPAAGDILEAISTS